MSGKYDIVLWIENVFSHGWVLVILYMAFGVVIEELCSSPLLLLNRVVERLKVFDDLEKLFCKACEVIFLVFKVVVMTQVYSW